MIDRLNTRSATRVLVNSSYSKSVIDRVYGVNSTVNYLGVDTKVFKSIGDKKQKYVLSVGNLSLLKGHDFIIRSLNRIPENIRPKLIIIGNGGVEKDELIRLANKLNVTMEIHEKLNDQDLVSYYNRASAFLFAAMGEPFGLVLLEAAASGIPIIAVGEGGVREILTKMPNTVLVKRDEKVFAEKLISYLNHPKNDISKLQIAYVKKYWSWEKSVGQLDRVLTETLV
jgi:glycosyltransferase involved in cell wall biosynthesis